MGPAQARVRPQHFMSAVSSVTPVPDNQISITENVSVTGGSSSAGDRRYPQGGGLTDERREFHEWIRLEAAGMFAERLPNGLIAKRLRVSVRSVQRWRQAHEADGGSRTALERARILPEAQRQAVRGAGGRAGQGVGYAQPTCQTWTLARIRTLIGHRFTDPGQFIRSLHPWPPRRGPR
ncbi:helix-turn-helix domain-containing protein [Streptomyces nondiastaticus]|uniref:helix-turn-helix domain-containing protein n=1 Tax=Streptomyces nondiastaticus TaxID=3154512 RepID=UPI003424BEB7